MKMMTKRWIAPIVILLLTLWALPAFAADTNGKWTCRVNDADDNALTLIFVFKQEGTQLTGTLTVMDDRDKILDSTSINNGKVDGDKIYFVVVVSDGQRFTDEGTIHTDEIALTVVSSAQSSETSEITLKRSK